MTRFHLLQVDAREKQEVEGKKEEKKKAFRIPTQFSKQIIIYIQ